MNRVLSLFVLLFGLCAFTARAASPETPGIAQARELVDSYYGQRAKLTEAVQLVDAAYRANPRDANVFVLAARITIMGGHLGFGEYEPGSVEAYGSLLDKAIALDPTLPKPYILKAEVARQGKDYDEELRLLDKAQALGTSDPWLQVGYAEHYRLVKDAEHLFATLNGIIQRGPGTTASDRKAYLRALRIDSELLLPGEDEPTKLRRNAALALAARHPDDAWSPLSYAESFIDILMFDDAITYSREALKTMDFGAARHTLAASLYAKAAQMSSAGRPEAETRPYVQEAARLGFPKASIINYLVNRRGTDGNTLAMQPMLEQVIP